MALESFITIVFYLVSIVSGSGLQSYATAPSGSEKFNSYGKETQDYGKDYAGSHVSTLLNEDYNSQSLHDQINSYNQMLGSHVPLSDGYGQHVGGGSISGDASGEYYHSVDFSQPSLRPEMWQSGYAPSGYSSNVHSNIPQSPQLQYYEAIGHQQIPQSSASDLSIHQQNTPDYSQHYTPETVESQKYNQPSFDNHDNQHDAGLTQQYQQQNQHGTNNQHQVDVINYVPVPVVKKVHVPYRNPVQIPVSHTVIIPVPKPVPIHIPITKQVQVPVEKELKIPVERLVPYPVEKKIPYPVEKRVPFQVVKYVPVKVHKPYAIKVPVVKTVLHKVKGWW